MHLHAWIRSDMHARGKVNMNEYYFMNSMNELLWSMTWIYNNLSQQNMNIIWLTNVNKKFESQHKNSWSNNSTKKTLCQFHKNCKEQKFKNTMFYIIHYKLLKSLLKILSTVFIE